MEPLPERLKDVRDRCFAFLDPEELGMDNWKSVGMMQSSNRPTELQVSQFKNQNRPAWAGRKLICVRGKLRFPHAFAAEILELIVQLDKRPKWDEAMLRGQVRKAYQAESRWPKTEQKGESEPQEEGPETESIFNAEERSSSAASTSSSRVVGCDIVHLEYGGVPLLVDKRDLCLFRFWESWDMDDNGENQKENEKEQENTTGPSPSASSFAPLRRAVLMAQSVEHEAVPEVKGSVRAELAECGYFMQEGITYDSRGNAVRYCDVTYITSLDFKGMIPKVIVNLMLRQQPGTLKAMRMIIARAKGGDEKECSIM